LKKVRDLSVIDQDGNERNLPIAAASALLRVKNQLLVLSDDERQMAIFEDGSHEPGTLIKVMEGDTPSSPDQRADHKPDFECMAHFEAFGRFEHGAILALGSGSAPDRDRATLLELTSDGRPGSDFEIVDLGPLYDHLRADIDDLNIEGGAVVGDVFRLMQRGNGPDGRNARVDLDAVAVRSALVEGDTLQPDAVLSIEFYDLGQLKGVPLCFSDASPLPDGRMVFIASAEADDGNVGSSIGLLDPDGSLELNEPVDHNLKLEGLAADVGEDGRVHLLMVSDADDPDKASPLMETYLKL
ncbi:MAG: hypothetical protein M3333_01135, partial [Actinomycetota bacterium]|nr:hypothetical protein [Actinomycetota bacterium]